MPKLEAYKDKAVPVALPAKPIYSREEMVAYVKQYCKDHGLPEKMNWYGSMPVIDAVEPLEFTITDIHKRLGKPKDEANCVLSLGAKDATGAPEARVGKARTLLMDKSRMFWWRYRTSAHMRQQFINGDKSGNIYFDLGSYKLAVFPASKRIGNGTQGTKTRPTKPTGKKREDRHIGGDGIRVHGYPVRPYPTEVYSVDEAA